MKKLVATALVTLTLFASLAIAVVASIGANHSDTAGLGTSPSRQVAGIDTSPSGPSVPRIPRIPRDG
jgi:hypothetical protein